jgi:heme O synthase-like polyprenyltransferase
MKKWYKSKTVWANIIGTASGIAALIAGDLATGGSVTAASVLNIILRVVTKQAIGK